MDKTCFRLSWLFLPLFLGLTMVMVWANVLADNAAAYPLAISKHPQGTPYSVVTRVVTNSIEYRFMAAHHHFMTLIDEGGTFIFRPHPGCDINGWGSSWYAQPFLTNATLRHTTIQTVTAAADGIHIIATGKVSRGTTYTYGNWAADYFVSYDFDQSKITGNGTYSIALEDVLFLHDLNLYKIASNYLDDVPLLPDSSIGDTGDMRQVIATGDDFVFTWTPPITPGFFPTNQTDYLKVEVLGNLNHVDTQAMGYAPIAPAFKPPMTVVLSSTQPGVDMTFGAFYVVPLNQAFWEDNVGITPLVPFFSAQTQFSFVVTFTSQGLEGCTYLPLNASYD